MNIDALYATISAHPWMLLAIVIGLIVRLLKSDTKIPIDVAPAHRKLLAVILAALGGGVEKFAMGATWKEALLHAALAWLGADLGHYFVIGKLRGGKELPIPLLTIPGVAPGPGKPPSIPPGKKPGVPPLAVFMFVFVLPAGCESWTKQDTKNAVDGGLSAIQIACVIANSFVDDQTLVMKACNVADKFGPLVRDLIFAEKTATAAREKVGAPIGKMLCVKGEELVACELH